MLFQKQILLFILAFLTLSAGAQKIVYSEPDRDDTRRMPFEVIGKVGGNFLVYKNNRSNRHIISVLNNDMQQVALAEQDYFPDGDRMINLDFYPYSDFCYIIYQYQKKNVVYCMASKIDGMGKPTGTPVELDTTHLNFGASNKIYTSITSEDKGRLMVFKINTKNRKSFLLSTVLLDDKLAVLKRSQLPITMDERNEYLDDFHLDNDGDLVFARFFRNSNDNISTASLMIKSAQADSVAAKQLSIDKNWLDEITIRVDNANKRYLLTSFYFTERRGNIEGYYFYMWDKAAGKPILETNYAFTPELRSDARGDATMKTAFNDFFIRNIIVRKDGGFIIGSESYYTTSRFNNWNRWDYLYGSPFYGPNYYNSPYYYYYNNYWNNNRITGNTAVRYHADNIAVISFNSRGQAEWSNVMGKSQYDDETDDLLSYQMMNTGGELHFLYNAQERRNNLLTDFSITPEGQLTRNPTLKNLDKGYQFMPKYAKQVSARQMIIPVQYRNYICFAKLDYN